jgi:hypothetical protein
MHVPHGNCVVGGGTGLAVMVGLSVTGVYARPPVLAYVLCDDVPVRT